METEIEGSWGRDPRQTATRMVAEMVSVQDDSTGTLNKIPWPYSYLEIAECNHVETPSEATELFEGFLGLQAQHFFEMTKRVM